MNEFVVAVFIYSGWKQYQEPLLCIVYTAIFKSVHEQYEYITIKYKATQFIQVSKNHMQQVQGIIYPNCSKRS